MLCISAAYAVMRCLSVSPFVCLSVMFVDHVKTNEHIFELFSPSGIHAIQVYPHQRGWRYSDENSPPPNGGVECRWGIGRNRDSGLIAGYRRLLDVRSAKTFTDDEAECMTQSATHHWLSIDCWTCELRSNKKQLPTTMQCRSHSRQRTSECLFVTACMHVRIRRREENRKEVNCIKV